MASDVSHGSRRVAQDPLVERIDQVCAQARRLAWRYVLVTLVGVAIGAWAALAWVDYFVRPPFAAWRYLQSALWAAILAATAVDLAGRWRALRLDRRGVVRRLERIFPQVKDWLEAAVEFLSSDPGQLASSSAALRQGVVHRARQLSSGIDFAGILHEGPSRRRSLGAASAVVLLAISLLVAPSVVLRSWQRLLMPASNVPWPRAHHLALVDLPQEIPAGSDLAVRVADLQGRLPRRVQLEYRPADDPRAWRRQLGMRRDGKHMHARIVQVTQSLQLRALGGDDADMAWHTVRVVPPQRLPSARVILHWPEYTGWGTTEAPLDHLRVLPGTQIACSGSIEVGTGAAALCFRPLRGDPPSVVRRALRLTGGRFELPGGQALHVEESGDYWLQWTDRGGRRIRRTVLWRITVHPDEPPEVRWADESSGPNLLARSAHLPLQLEVREEVGIHAASILYREANRPDEPWQAAPLTMPAEEAVQPWTATDRGGSRRQMETEWGLADHLPEPIDEWVYKVRVVDRAGQSGETTVRHLRLAGDAQLEESWRDQLASLVEQLTELASEQQEAVNRTQMVLDGAPSAKAREELLADIQPLERNVHQKLIGGSASVLSRLAELRQAIGGDRTELAEDLEAAQAGLEQAANDRLPHIDQLLRTLAAQNPAPGDARWADLVGEQRGALRSLEQALERIGSRYHFQSLLAELTDLRGQQSEVTDQMQQLQRQWLAQLSADDHDALEARRNQLGQRQQQLAWQVQQWGERLAGMHQQPPSVPRAQEALQAAYQAWQTAPPPLPMRESAWQLDKGHIGQAVQLQPEIQQRLTQIDHRLRTGSSSPASSVPSPAAPEDAPAGREALLGELAAVIEAQELLAVQTRQADGTARGRLAPAQRELARRTSELPLDGVRGAAVAWSVQSAAEQMGVAAELLLHAPQDERIDSAQREAADRLTAVRRALEEEASGDPGASSTAGDTVSADTAQRPAEDRSLQLAVILNLQRGLAAEVQRLAAGGDASTQEAQWRLDQLAQTQAKIVGLLEQMETEGGPPAPPDVPAPEGGDERRSIDEQLDQQFFSPLGSGSAPESEP